MEVKINLDEVHATRDICVACANIFTCNDNEFYKECPLKKLLDDAYDRGLNRV